MKTFRCLCGERVLIVRADSKSEALDSVLTTNRQTIPAEWKIQEVPVGIFRR